MLVNLKDIFNKYLNKSQAVAAFNVANIDTVRAVIDAAKIENKPVVIQVFRRLFEDEMCEYLAEIVKFAAEKTKIPIVLHLDHGSSISQIKKAVELGFSSVMIDGSSLSYNDNVSLVLEAKKLVESHSISIEAELGGIPLANTSRRDLETMFTDPDEALSFIEDTDVDALAVSIGTAHGIYIEKPRINFELLKQITEKTSVPIVLHGGTGVPDEDIRKSITLGVKKVNIATELQKFYIDGFKKAAIKNERRFIPLDVIVKPLREGLTELVKTKIKLISG